jgi:hypothetical protein
MSVPISRDSALEQFGLSDWSEIVQCTNDFILIRDVVGNFVNEQ